MTSIFILASGGPHGAWSDHLWSLKKYVNKALLEIRDDYTILDSQLDLLVANGLTDITIVVGYKSGDIMQHCLEHQWESRYLVSKIIFLLDPTWRGTYSSGRTLWEIQKQLLNASFPVLTIYCDVVFNQKTLTDLMNCKADVCCVRNSQNLIKWSKNGVKKLVDLLNESKEYRFNKDGLSYPTWGRLKWDEDICWGTVRGGQMVNINNDRQYVEFVGRKFATKFKRKVRGQTV